MPRNGSGFYTLPAGNPVVDATVIESTWANPTMSDIAVQLNNVVTRDGVLAPSSPISFQGGNAALPGVTFAGYGNSGFYRSVTVLGVSFGGATVATFTAAGAAIIGALAVSGDAVLAQLNSGQLAGLRNRIINGDFTIFQRGASGVAPTLAYLADRWYSSSTGTAPTFSQNDSTGGPGESFKAITLLGAAGNALVTLWQRIEAANAKDLANKSVTVSYWVYQSTGGAVNCQTALYYPTSTDDFSTNTLIETSAGTLVHDSIWSKVVSTFSVPAAAVTGLMVALWANGTPILAGKQLRFAKAQLETGTVATPFEVRPIGLELTLCQRYYSAVRGGLAGMVNSATTVQFAMQFAPPMRAAPAPTVGVTLCTINTYDSNGINPSSQSLTSITATDVGAVFQINNYSGLTAGQAVVMTACTGSPYAAFSAEL